MNKMTRENKFRAFDGKQIYYHISTQNIYIL